MFVGQLALIVAAAFTGAAIYVSFAEQPARLGLDDRALLAEWKPSYKHGFAMQGCLALVGAVLGAIAWWQTGIWLWLAGALLLFSGWPYTLIVIKPTNDRLLATNPSDAVPESRKLIEYWGQLHLGRVALGLLATCAFLATTLSA
ncbi:MAG TPA: DUF1772 domain-containing protein [Methyloceanibacter sp.]